MDSSRTGFQDLPAEMRLEVYSNISPPLTEHLAVATKGLMLSCQQVHAEMEDAIVRKMNKYLDEMKDEWYKTYGTTLEVSRPTTPLEVKKGITVTIPRDFMRVSPDRLNMFPVPLLRLLPLHVENITLKAERIPRAYHAIGAVHVEFPAIGFVEELYSVLGIHKFLLLDNGKPHAVRGDGFLCADSLTIEGAWAQEGRRENLRPGEGDDWWFEQRTDADAATGAEVRKTWHRLCNFDRVMKDAPKLSWQITGLEGSEYKSLLETNPNIHGYIQASLTRDLPSRH